MKGNIFFQDRLDNHCRISLSFIVCLIILVCFTGSCYAQDEAAEYSYTEYSLERNGLSLHLDCVSMYGAKPDHNILLVHGSTYSSHEFDINYKDYSLVRRLAREGYAVWRLDIAGYGHSEQVEDGSIIDTEYAAEDINAAVNRIVELTSQEKIDVLGWSWGTMTAGNFAVKYPAHLGKLILYAPIVSGLGEQETAESFSHNTWDSAAEDFQRNDDGSFKTDITNPLLIELFCSSCWHYDGDSSPNGWSRDAFVSPTTRLIQLDRITVPTLLIYGDADPNLDYEQLSHALDILPEDSERCIIEGGSHIVMYEEPYYHEFQNQIISFLLQ